MATMADREHVYVGLDAVKKYRHPKSRRGVSNDVALKLGDLRRIFEDAIKRFGDRHNELVREMGVLDDPENPNSWTVKANSPRREEFRREVDDLEAQEIEVPGRLKIRLSALTVRDENGEREPIELGEIGDLVLAGVVIDDREERAAAEVAEAVEG